MNIDLQTAGNILAVLALGGYGTFRGIRSIRRRNGTNGGAPEGKCPDPGCQAQVVHTAKEVRELKSKIDDHVFPKINKIAEDVAFIRGRTEDKKGD